MSKVIEHRIEQICEGCQYDGQPEACLEIKVWTSLIEILTPLLEKSATVKIEKKGDKHKITVTPEEYSDPLRFFSGMMRADLIRRVHSMTGKEQKLNLGRVDN